MKAKPVVILASLLFVAMGSLSADERDGKPHPEFQSRHRQWRQVKDSPISVCLALPKTTFAAGDGITLRCAIRNDSDKALTVLSPFGDTYFTTSTGVSILGPDGPVSYKGPHKDYVLSPDSFIELPARSVIEGEITITHVAFPGLDKPGLFTIDYRYASQGHPAQPPPANYWTGYVDSNAVSVLVK